MSQQDDDPADCTSALPQLRPRAHGIAHYSPLAEPQGLCEHCQGWGYHHIGPTRLCPTDALCDALDAARELVALADETLIWCGVRGYAWSACNVCGHDEPEHAPDCRYVTLRRRILGQPEEEETER